MGDRIIQQADLSAITRHLGSIDCNVNIVNQNVGHVNSNVSIILNEVGKLKQEFEDFVYVQIMANRLGQAETRLVKIRQELDKKYGHYDVVRRTTTGILQADDLGIVKKETINNITDELMVVTPNYWLTPCLVALSAWINNDRELAEKAVKEGIRRNDEKTSLFFALVCRRAERMDGCLQWIRRYLANQDEENLDRKATIVLDAYASGLLGVDSEGLVTRQISQWLDILAAKPGFIEKQTGQWSDAIRLKILPLDSDYKYIERYSHTWPQLKKAMEGAYLHRNILKYFTDIFDKKSSTEPVKRQLDDILTSLVSDFDEEETPLRKEERLEQLVVNFKGDEKRARRHMQIEESAFDARKDFTQLLTDAAMQPESSGASVSTQKFAIALTRNWIINAYTDITAQNRMNVPHTIEINVDTFNGVTKDGENEDELIANFNALIDKEKADALAPHVLSGFEKFCMFGGIAIAIIGALMYFLGGSPFMGGIAVIAGIGMIIHHNSKKKQIEAVRKEVEQQFEEKRSSGADIIRAILAEVVDYRYEFKERDTESAYVTDFLSQITPEQYLRKFSGTKRIKMM